MDARTLRTARASAGLTLRELAERAGTSHSTIAAYEAGRVVPRTDTLDRILAACGVRLAGVPMLRPDRDPRRPPPDREFAQVLSLVEAVGGTRREDHPPWDPPVFGRVT